MVEQALTPVHVSDNSRENCDILPRETQIIFVHDEYNIGGLRTIEEELYKELFQQGFLVTVACVQNNIIKQSEKYISIFIHKSYAELVHRTNELVCSDVNRIILVSFKPKSAMASLLIQANLELRTGKKIRIDQFHWVSHSRAFFFDHRRILNLINRKAFSMLPVISTYFMNDAALASHANYWKKNLDRYPVLRILGSGRDRSKWNKLIRKHENNSSVAGEINIVSVGRLVSFKSYNLHAAEIVRQLRERDIHVTWDIWGYGQDEKTILQMIEANGVSESVRLRGTLSHDQFDATVASYDLFIGMGVAALEAAKNGVPTILAVENCRDACYGHLHESPLDTVGDQVEGFHGISIGDVIEKFNSMNPAERAEVGRLDQIAAYSRESTLAEFTSAVVNASGCKIDGIESRIWLVVMKVMLHIVAYKRKISRIGKDLAIGK
jgi:hypothetical protein